MGIVSAVEASERYAHPRNAPLLKLLKEGAMKGTGGVHDLDGYQLRTAPDLGDLLRSLNPACFGGAYGHPVLASARGVIFSVAQGVSYLAFRLPDSDRDEVTETGGFDCLEPGQRWFGFQAWNTGKDILTKWCRAAHAHANNIELGKKP